MTLDEAQVAVSGRWGQAGFAHIYEGRWGETIYSVGTVDGTRYGTGSSFEEALEDCDRNGFNWVNRMGWKA